MSSDAAANSAVPQTVSIRFDAVPGTSPLFLSFLNESGSECDLFWPNRNESLLDYARIALDAYEADRDILCDALAVENKNYGASSRTLKNIELLRSEGCVAVVTGQQAGFLGGPSYTVYKALTAIRIASNLTNEGVKAVPVFWIATEDHDFEEISKVHFRGAAGTLVSGEIAQSEDDEGKPVGNLNIGADVGTALEAVFSKILQTRFTAEVRQLAESSFREGLNLGEAFGRLLTSILGYHGLILVNPLNPTVRALSSDILLATLKNLKNINRGLKERDAVLAKNGFHSQVFVPERVVPLFVFDKEGRRRGLESTEDEQRFTSKGGGLNFAESDLFEIAKKEPARFSPNALLRPVVQDSVFPTVCYVGGAAEICYFAQNSSIYEVLGRPVTPIRHRSAFTIFEARHRRTVEAYGLDLKQIFEGRESIRDRLAESIADPGTMRLFDDTAEDFESQLSKIASALSVNAPDVERNLEKRRKKIHWHIQALRRKFVKSQERKNEDLVRRIDDLFDNVMPNGVLQERTVSYLDILNTHGPRVTDWIYRQVDGKGDRHKGFFF